MVTEPSALWRALAGGALIGLASALLLLLQGRVAGVSGAFKGLLSLDAGPGGWRSGFVVGLLVAGAAAGLTGWASASTVPQGWVVVGGAGQRMHQWPRGVWPVQPVATVGRGHRAVHADRRRDGLRGPTRGGRLTCAG